MDPDTALVNLHKNKRTPMKRIGIAAILVSAIVGIALGVVYHGYPQAALKAINIAYEWRAGVEAKSMEIDGYEVPYYEGGEGETLVLIHGFGDSMVSFLQTSAFLTEKYRVILPGVQGFGETSKVLDRDHSIRTQVETFHKFFQKLGLKEFYLGGNSMGGHISAAYALRYPNEIKRLILLNAAGLRVPGKLPYSHSEESIETEADFDKYLGKVFVKKPWVPGPLKSYLIEKWKENHDSYNLIKEQIRRGQDYLLNGRVSAFTKKTLVLWGRQDRIVRLAIGEAYHKDLPNSQMEIYDPGGHSPQYEFPERTAKTILQFLEE